MRIGSTKIAMSMRSPHAAIVTRYAVLLKHVPSGMLLSLLMLAHGKVPASSLGQGNYQLNRNGRHRDDVAITTKAIHTTVKDTTV